MELKIGRRSRRTPRRDRAARACYLNPDSSFKVDALKDTGGHLLTLFQLQWHSYVSPQLRKLVYFSPSLLVRLNADRDAHMNRPITA
ncbi:hypothetical protein Y032_0198g1620 [Ancylostoma ceylanicum]|uniref:Uncharacterized protein n=1 Tax=Ancylostoma ceylanicum TaxID=53326 RepID=A0A016SP11_9BILA|nr:hypothetical protein Y032_0198g1620 [Ancylostoma ceylanicum]